MACVDDVACETRDVHLLRYELNFWGCAHTQLMSFDYRRIVSHVPSIIAIYSRSEIIVKACSQRNALTAALHLIVVPSCAGSRGEIRAPADLYCGER